MLDSFIGYAAGTLAEPDFQDSRIGFAAGTLYDPGAYADSSIGYISGILSPPHHPIGTWNGAAIAWSTIGTWDGHDIV